MFSFCFYSDFSSWSFGKKQRAETPAENGSKSDLQDNHKRRSGDPKERLRKEQDRIVLSPQRESFNHGCFVPAGREALRITSNRAHSPLGGKNDGGNTHSGSNSNARRIGSGRIIRDPWDDDFGSGFRRDNANNNRDERYERRSFNRDFDKEKDRHIGRGSNGRFNDRRRISADSKEEEPEWFSGGPLSQTDTIELRGFDDNDKAAAGFINKKKQSPAHKKRTAAAAAAKTKTTNNDTQQQQSNFKKTEENADGEKKEGGSSSSSSVVKTENVDVGAGGDDGKNVGEEGKVKEKEQMAPNLDFFFNEAISGLLTVCIQLCVRYNCIVVGFFRVGSYCFASICKMVVF